MAKPDKRLVKSKLKNWPSQSLITDHDQNERTEIKKKNFEG